MAVEYAALRLSAEDRAFHWREALRLRALAETITTDAARDRILARALQHERLIGLINELPDRQPGLIKIAGLPR
jgi:hypothetical protein